MKAWQALLGFSIAFYAVISWLLARPISVSEKPSGTVADSAVISKQEVILKMAEFVEKKGVKVSTRDSEGTTFSPVEVGGFELNSDLKNQLSTAEGLQALRQRIGERGAAVVLEVEAAFKEKQFHTIAEREILLDLANALVQLQASPTLTERFALEAKESLRSADTELRGYGGRALQYYLSNESDGEKKSATVQAIRSAP